MARGPRITDTEVLDGTLAFGKLKKSCSGCYSSRMLKFFGWRRRNGKIVPRPRCLRCEKGAS